MFTCFWWEEKWAELGRQCRYVMGHHMVKAKYPEWEVYSVTA